MRAESMRWCDGFRVSSNHKVPDADKALIPSEPIAKDISAHRKIEKAIENKNLSKQLKEVWDYE